MDESYIWDNVSVCHKHWLETLYVEQWPIFHGPVILSYILKIVWWTDVIIGLSVPCGAKIYLIKCMWVSNLHFMTHNFVFYLDDLFDGWILYLGYWFSVTHTLTLNYIFNIGSMWCKDLLNKMYVGQWPIFHGPVILPYILKTIYCIKSCVVRY